MRAYDIKAERGRRATLETPDFLEQARQLLSRTLPVELRMSGTSMRPAIEDGDMITLEPITADPIKPGDIVLYHSRFDTAVIHRVIRVERYASERCIVTRGDAASHNDEPVPLHRILGRVSRVERAGERIRMVVPRRTFAQIVMSWFHRLRFW